MASRSPVQLSQLIEHYEITEAQLKKQWSGQHLATLARSGNFLWREWAGQFGLSDQQIKDLEVDLSLDGAGKAQGALNMWHKLNAFTATYQRLVEIFLEGGNAILAGDVCELLRGTTSSDHRDQHRTQTKTKCKCTPLQTSFLDELRNQLNTIKTFSRKEIRLEPAKDVVSKYVKKFIQAGSTPLEHLHEHLQQLHKRELLISDPEVLDMAKTLADDFVVRTTPSPSSLSQGSRPASSPTPRRAKPLFSKHVVYHASVCCQAVNNCTHNNCSAFFKDGVGHSFKEVSISRSEEGRYLIAVQDSTYYIAFQGEPDIAQWPEKYKSFSEGISSQCKYFPTNFILELLRTENNFVVLTGFSLGGLLASSVHVKMLDLPNVSAHLRERLVCVTFAQPHVPIPGLNKLAKFFPDVVSSTVHAIQFEMDLVPRLLGLLHQPSKTFEDNYKKLVNFIGQEYSQTSLTESSSSELVQEVRQLSSGIELAKAIPAIEQPLTYHLLFPGSDGLVLQKMTSEEISSHHSYQIENIPHSEFTSYLENHSMEEYSKMIDGGYLNKAPEYKIPPKQSISLPAVQALKPGVTSVDLINHGCELDFIVEGSNLWFYNKLSLYDQPLEPIPRTVQNIGTCLHVKISGKCCSDLRSLKDGRKITIGFHTHFSTRWEMDVECHTKAYAMNCRQEQLAKLSPSEVIELSYLNALLEYQPHDSTQPLSDRMTAIRKFLEEVVKVVPLESIGYSVAYGDSHIKQQCAKALETLRELSPSKMMIDALTKAKTSCELCSSAPKEPETGLPENATPNPAGNCLCSSITQLLANMGSPKESTGIISGLNLKELYPITRSIRGLNSPIDTLRHGRKRLSLLSAKKLLTGGAESTNITMLKTVNGIRQQELAVCISLLGSFMDQQEIDIPLSKSDNLLNVAAKATVGVWAISNLDLERVQTLVEECPGEELVVNVNVEDYIVDEDQRLAKDGQYAAKLHFVVQGLKKTVTCNTQYISYSLERQLADLCKDKPAIHPDSLEHLINEWDKIFEKNILSLIARTYRPMIARWLNWSLMVHKLREELAKYTTIGVVGPVNSGKSTIVKTLFKLDMIYPGTIEEKRTTVPFIYNLKGEGLDEGLNIDVVDFPGVDDRDESVSDLTPLLLHLVQIIIFVVNVRVAHTGSCKQWLEKLRASSSPLLICLTHSDKLFAEIKGEKDVDPSKQRMEQEFQRLSEHLQLPDDQEVMFCSFKQDADSILNNEKGRKKLREVGIKTPTDVGNWVAETFRKNFKQRDVSAKLKELFTSSLGGMK